jgi:hypothetical protein
MATKVKWKRVRPGLYRADGIFDSWVLIERGGELGGWWWRDEEGVTGWEPTLVKAKRKAGSYVL